MTTLYEEATHPRVAVGQLWRYARLPGTALIVAVDRGPAGFVVNVALEDGLAISGVRRVLAPVALSHLEGHLGEVTSEHVEVSEHLPSYLEWKEQAQAGKAGYWSCAPDQILATVRNGMGG